MTEDPGKTVEWYTPPYIVERLEKMFGRFDLDPCATVESTKAPRFFTKDDDGLMTDWFGNVFMNPPYGDEISDWCQKAAEEVAFGNCKSVVALLPARTGSKWYHNFIFPNIDVKVEIEGRINFLDESGNAAGSPKFDQIIVRLAKKFAPGFQTISMLASEGKPKVQRKKRITKGKEEESNGTELLPSL